MGAMNGAAKYLPLLVEGIVVPGFGRGGKQLGIPTANFSEELVDKISHDVPCGVYFGFANVNGGPVYPMAMSVGWNPQFKNEKKSFETHIIHNFAGIDFYGSMMRIVALGFIRQMLSFAALPELIAAIHADIGIAKSELLLPAFAKWRGDPFFTSGEIKPSLVVHKLQPSMSSSVLNNDVHGRNAEHVTEN